jgi:hypothetical protein
MSMDISFAPIRRTLAAFACAAFACGVALAQPQGPTEDNGTIPAGGKFKECHGYVRHVSTTNLKVHCIDGNASDQSFLYIPKYAKLGNGKTVAMSELKPETTVLVYYTQSLGIKKAYRVIVSDATGREGQALRT